MISPKYNFMSEEDLVTHIKNVVAEEGHPLYAYDIAVAIAKSLKPDRSKK